jgi:hypothetical protein
LQSAPLLREFPDGELMKALFRLMRESIFVVGDEIRRCYDVVIADFTSPTFLLKLFQLCEEAVSGY